MSNFIMTDSEFVEVVHSKQQCCADCDYNDNEFFKDNQMFIKPDNTFPTAKARNAAYTAFLRDLELCEDVAMIEQLKAENLDLFSKLREEEQLGYDHNGFEYLDELKEAINARKQQLLSNEGNENVYSG